MKLLKLFLIALSLFINGYLVYEFIHRISTGQDYLIPVSIFLTMQLLSKSTDTQNMINNSFIYMYEQNEKNKEEKKVKFTRNF